MSLKLWLARGSILSIAPVIEFASRFGRTALLSRLLLPNEFGTVVAMSVVIGTVALVSDMAIYKFVMIKPNDERALAAGHILTLARGFLLAVGVFFSAPVIAGSFGVPQFTAGFAFLAFIPLIQSFSHLGVRQVEGNYDYTPETRASLACQLAAFAVVVPAAYILNDHRAIIVSLLTECIVYAIVSHMVARTPYRIVSDRKTIYALLSFGIPVMFNGVGLAMVSQLDRAFIGSWFDVSTLALYAVILSMTTVPISLIDRIFGKMALSYLVSKARDSFAESYLILVFVFSVVGTAYSLFMAISLDVLTPLIFGSHFAVTSTAHILMTLRVFFVLQAMGAPTGLLSVTSRNRELALLNFSGAIGLVIAFVLVHWWPSIEAVMLGLFISDILRFPFFFVVASRDSDWRMIVKDLTSSCLVLAVIAGVLTLRPALTWEARGLVLCVGMSAIGIQLAFGLRRHSKLQTLFRRSDMI
jgi:O-antigen/teichoic acid export membrane protein